MFADTGFSLTAITVWVRTKRMKKNQKRFLAKSIFSCFSDFYFQFRIAIPLGVPNVQTKNTIHPIVVSDVLILSCQEKFVIGSF